jgi:hypothetical protein
VRGEKNLEGIQKMGVFHRKLVDSGRAWSNFEIFQLYSPNTEITAKTISKIINNTLADKTSVGKGLCDSRLAAK